MSHDAHGGGAGDAAPAEAKRDEGGDGGGEGVMLDIPYEQQLEPLNCGPTALRMVLRFLQPSFTPSQAAIGDVVGIRTGEGVSTVKLAIAAAKYGFRAVFRSVCLVFTEEHLRHDFYRRHGDVDAASSSRLVAEAKAVGVDVKEEGVELEEIFEHLRAGEGVVVLVDLQVLLPSPERVGYNGHFMAVAGFNATHVHLINQGGGDDGTRVAVTHAVFDAARKAEGTDEDILFVTLPSSG